MPTLHARLNKRYRNRGEKTGSAAMHRIVIVGGGVAGLEIATKLRKSIRRTPIAVTLIDREPAHVWKPMLHTIAAGTSDVSQQETHYVAHASHHGYIFEPGELKNIDRAARTVRLGPVIIGDRRILPERDIPYDTLILAIGSQANDFGTPGVRAHCFMLDSRSQALEFNREVQSRMLQSIGARTALHVAVVGGGATGVELAAELIQLAEIAENFGAVGLRDRLNVTLMEAAPQLLGAFPKRVAVAARERLERLGVTVLTDAQVVAAEADCFRLSDGRRVPAELKVWAAGIKGPEASLSSGGLEMTRNGRLVVRPTLQTTLDPRIFAIGDCASVQSRNGSAPAPPTAQVAHQQAAYLIRHLPRWLIGKAPPPFTYRDLGAIVSLGGYGAYGSLGRFGLLDGAFIRGRIAQLGHIFLYRSHQARLHGFWRGGLMWLADRINAHARPRIPSPDPG